MSNVGKTLYNETKIIGVVVEEITKRGKVFYRYALPEGAPRNPVLGDFGLTQGVGLTFAPVEVLGYSGPATTRELRELARAGGDATLLRR
jgi:hypothetical protein